MVYQCVDFDALYFAGDVNGRIGDKLDFIEEVDPVPHRVSIDHVFNHHGATWFLQRRKVVYNQR